MVVVGLGLLTLVSQSLASAPSSAELAFADPNGRPIRTFTFRHEVARWLPSPSSSPSESRDILFDEAKFWMAETFAQHGVEPSSLQPDSISELRLSTIGSTDKLAVRFTQRHDGIAVPDATVNVLFDLNTRRLLAIATSAVPASDFLQLTPKLSKKAARLQAAQLWDAGDRVEIAGTVWAPIATNHKYFRERAYHIKRYVSPTDTHPKSEAWIGMTSGKVLKSESNEYDFDVNGNVRAWVSQGISPDTSSYTLGSQPMGGITVTTSEGQSVVTDFITGNFTVPVTNFPVSISVTLNGPYLQTNTLTGSPLQTAVQLTSVPRTFSIVLNNSPSEEVTAQVNAAYWANRLRNWIKYTNANDTVMDFTMVMDANRPNYACAASFSGLSVRFGMAGTAFVQGLGYTTCPNSSFHAWVTHEAGHWLNLRYGTGNSLLGMGEGAADAFAMYVADNSVVGKDYYGPGTVVRNGDNTRTFCGDTNLGCYGESHKDGEVLMGALWKVRSTLQLPSAYGRRPGGLIADRLLNSWFNAFDDQYIQSVIKTHWLILDDDDGNLQNGTPHATEISAGFAAQGIL